MKAVARSFVWWERLDGAIESIVRSYQACQSVSTPTSPMAVAIAAYTCGFRGTFLGKDVFAGHRCPSKWPKIIEMKSTTATKP